MPESTVEKFTSAFQFISEALTHQAGLMNQALEHQASRNARSYQEASEEISRKWQELGSSFGTIQSPAEMFSSWIKYNQDVWERSVLTLDILRQRGDIFEEHAAAGSPPVLVYDYDIVMDGQDLPRPCNYMLLRIKPEVKDNVHDWKRPYVIIDPRAGHGPGIGGFKPDSQVGVALADGHPVYFVAFRPMPVEGQTLADVTHAEAAFLREIHKLHPDAPRPVVVGNCQGGWATALLAATNPDLTGPIVLNGAPMSYWAGRLGQDPMRYTGGVVGGVLPAKIMSDLGGGIFDGAHLVLNFETLNPGRTWLRKYYDVFANADADPTRFLEFERWWGGFFLMNEAEISWIIENLFVGNRLGKNEARLETGRPVDLKTIQAPIIVFASHGDNITPPQQALHWITDTYTDETEIEIRGQRIIYMVHEEVGHLGIFVSSSVARKEHTQMASTLKTIEALPPGLYEMIIEEVSGSGKEKTFTVDFLHRTMADLHELDDGRFEEPAFAAVARMSESVSEAYEATVRPAVQAAVTPYMAELGRKLHPMRAQRWAFASSNPLMHAVEKQSQAVRENRHQLSDDNLFRRAEGLCADYAEQSLNLLRDMRTFWSETTFLNVYGSPFSQWYGQKLANTRTRKSPEELRALVSVQTALAHIETGGLPEAIVRMLVLLAATRGNVRRDRLERSSEVLTSHEPFVSMDAGVRAHIIHEQTVIVRFESEAALQALPKLLSVKKKRDQAFEKVHYIVGAAEEMEPHTYEIMNRMRAICGLEPVSRSVVAAAE